MTESHEGACLCGAVRFKICGPFEGFFLCHCTRCQKGSGSAHAANLFSSSAKLTWLSGEAKIKTYQLPSTRHQRSFCAECGSPVPNTQMNGAVIVAPAGGFDSAIAIRPTAHICTASRASWDHDLQSVPSFEALPE